MQFWFPYVKHAYREKERRLGRGAKMLTSVIVRWRIYVDFHFVLLYIFHNEHFCSERNQ